MRLVEYQARAARTATRHRSKVDALCNWSMGLTGEAGELVDALKKECFHGRRMSDDDFISEAGDVLWYLTMLCQAKGVSLDEVANANLEKLMSRYPDGFVKGGGNR